MALVIMGHRRALAGLEGQAGLGSIQRLDLAFLVDGQDHGVVGRAHVEADDVFDLGGEGGILGALEGAQPMGLQAMRLPDSLDGTQGNARRLRHGAAGPVGDLTGRLGTGQRQHLGHLRREQGRLAGFAGLVSQQAIDTLLGIAHLPAPDGGAADPNGLGHLKNVKPLGRAENDMGALNMFERTTTVGEDRRQPLAILSAYNDADDLGHDRRVAQLQPIVNRAFASVH
jgi:hypothetical protein